MGAATTPAKRRKLHAFTVPQAAALDLDRTLCDVTAGLERLYAAASLPPSSVDIDRIRAAQKQIEADGGSFTPLPYIFDSVSPAAFAEICDHFIDPGLDAPAIFYPDAPPFLERLQRAGLPYYIITYGEDRLWQWLKMKAGGYHGGYSILSSKNKSIEFAKLRSASGTFDFQAGEDIYHAASLCLVDDKASSFEALPAGCTGFMIERGKLLPSQRGYLPPTVQKVRSLDDLIVVEKRLQKDNTAGQSRAPTSPAQKTRTPSGRHATHIIYTPLYHFGIKKQSGSLG